MHKVGDEIDGYCPRCRLNTYQNVAATDGRTVLAATCRTCRNSFPWKAEVSPEDIRSKHMEKLQRLQRQRTGGPDVISRGRKKVGDLEQAQANRLSGATETVDASGELPARGPAAAPVATSGVAPSFVDPNATDRWRELTAKLGWRDGKPYNAARIYKAGDVLLHKALGLGVVQAVVHEGACVVLFRDKEAVLEMGQPDNS
jgi:hypothetical protein